MMNTTIANELFESGNKVITSLTEAKGTLDSAERWANEDLKSICSFLTIINGTLNDTKHNVAQATIHNAEAELQKFNELLSAFSLPEKYISKLNNASLPEEIRATGFFDTKLSHEEYENFRSQLDSVIESVTEIINYIN